MPTASPAVLFYIVPMPNPHFCLFTVIAALLSAGTAGPLQANDLSENASVIEEVVAYGRSESRIGTVSAATAGWVAADDIRLPPLMRTGELIEAVTGMVATQHSGTGKANQLFLRGFNLDHGTDFSAFLDGMPINLRSHGHGQGYLDLNFLIPEIVASTEFRKGPYRADRGDFSSAGSAEFRYYRELPENLTQLTVGEDGYQRALVTGSARFDSGTWTTAVDATRDNGPWKLEEDLEQYRIHSAFSTNPESAWSARVALDGYHSRWDATDQIPERAVRSGVISRNGFIDPDLGGNSSRWSINGNVSYGDWQASAYGVRHDFDLYSNFTYLLEDPLNGDEFHQYDRRNLYGFALGHERELGRELTISIGVDGRYDDVRDIGLEQTVARERIATIREDQIKQRSVGSYVEFAWQPLSALRVLTGLRYDWTAHDVDARLEANSGDGSDTVLSPSLNLAYRLRDSLELYANWGRGFHSNDVRGVNLSIDPATAEPAESLGLFAQSEGAELGLRYEHGREFSTAITLFWLDLENELVFVGDAGSTEVNDSSRRYGVEASLFWQANRWLAANLDYTRTRARYRQDSGEGRFIPGAIDTTVSLGLFADWQNGFGASARLRYLSAPPLTGDNHIQGDDSTVANIGVSYRHRAVTMRLDLFNALDTDASDIAYFYASRLPGESTAGVEDVHSHPLMPRTLRLSLSWAY